MLLGAEMLRYKMQTKVGGIEFAQITADDAVNTLRRMFTAQAEQAMVLGEIDRFIERNPSDEASDLGSILGRALGTGHKH
jgi:hypothetical protein